MNRALWIVQGILAVTFLAHALIKFTLPTGLPSMLSWVYDIPRLPSVGIGVLELLGAIGIVLPGLTRILPGLVVWAAVGLMLTMTGGAIFHVTRAEWSSIPINIVTFAMAAFVAYGRRSWALSSPSSS